MRSLMRFPLSAAIAASLLVVQAAQAQQAPTLDDLIIPNGTAPGVPAAPVAPQPAEPEVDPRDEAFDRALQTILPMEPGQIDTFRGRLDDTRRSIARPSGPVNPQSRSMDVTLKPGERPPLVKLAGGFVTTLTFSDITGAPWPVLSVTTGDPANYLVQNAGKAGDSNIVVVSPLSYFAQSNLVITLLNNPVPVVMKLETNVGDVDYRVDMRVTQRGPNAQMDALDAQFLPPTSDSTLLSFLDGLPPQSARKMKTNSGMVEAWEMDEMLFIRTEAEVLSPAYLASAKSVSGMNIYMLTETPSLIISRDGRMASVSIAY